MKSLYFITFISFLTNFFVLYKSLGITYFSRGLKKSKDGKITLTDNEKIITNAKKFKLFSWVSSVHQMKLNRAQLREFWFLTISIISKFFKKPSEIIIVGLSLFSNFISTILIYLIFENLFDAKISLIISLFYLSSLWPFQISLYVGHIIFSQVFFLLSIFILLIHEKFLISFFPFFISGALLMISFSSSSSSRKFPPLVLLIFFYINFDNLSHISYLNLFERFDKFMIFTIIFLFLIIIYHQVLKIKILSYLIKKNYSNEIEQKIKKVSFKYSNIFFLIIFISAIFLFCLENNIFLVKFVYFLIGISFILFLILAPNFIENIARYFAWFQATDWANHFRVLPKNYFSIDTSGNYVAPISWLPKFFIRMIPIIFIIYLLSIFILLFFLDLKLIYKFILIIISLIPLIIMEITKAARLGRSHFPILISFLFLIGFTINEIILIKYFELIIYLFLFIQIIHSLFYFFSDLLPCRMSSVNLRKQLIRKNIKKFSTYNNVFNEANLFPMLHEYQGEFNVNFTDSIAKSKTKFFLVPATSSKSVSFETNQEVINTGDFKADKILNYLIKHNLMNKCSIIKLPTFGTSKFYVLESEITSFRDLILKDINIKDIKLSFLYVIDCDLVKKYIN